MPQNEDDPEMLIMPSIDDENREEASQANMADLQSLICEEAAPLPGTPSHADWHRFIDERGLWNCFVSEKWHRPYAQALMETDPGKRAPLIAGAEHAIFDRYLELSISPGPIEQSRDLQTATNVLIDLKNAMKNPTVIAQKTFNF